MTTRNKNDTETEAEIEITSTEEVDVAVLDKRSTSYLNLQLSRVENPFLIQTQYDEIIHLLHEGATMLTFHTLGMLLEVASNVLGKQINCLKKDVLQLLEETNRIQKNAVGSNRIINTSTIMGSPNTNCTAIGFDNLSQDTGYDTQHSLSLSQTTVERADSSLTQEPVSETPNKWPTTKGKYRVSIRENDKISTSLNDTPSIAARRRLLYKKFDGLASGMSMNSDNLCHFYVNCAFQKFSDVQTTTDVMSALIKYHSFTVQATWYEHLEFPMFSSDQESELGINSTVCDIERTEGEAVGDDIGALMPSGNTFGDVVGDTTLSVHNTYSTNDLQDVENRSNENFASINQAENMEKLKATTTREEKKAKKRRILKSRKPLEQLSNQNSGEDHTTMDENFAPEMKRLRIDEESILHDEESRVDVVPCVNLSKEFNPDSNPTNSDFLEDNILEDTDYSHRIPSPLFDKGESSRKSGLDFRKFSPTINMGELTSQISNVVEPLKNHASEQNDMKFEDVIMKSGIQIADVCDMANSNGKEVSVHVAFLALLHSASENKLYLIETDDESLKVSNVKPEDHREPE